MMPFKVAVACFFLPLASPTGLKLSVYKDTAMGLSGNIAWSSVVQTARIDINSSSVSGGPFSAELLGTVSLPFGTHKFDCTFAETSLAWLWIGDHMVCSDGKSNPIGKPGAYDNPLPVRRPEGRPPYMRELQSPQDCRHERRRLLGHQVLSLGCSHRTYRNCGKGRNVYINYILISW